MCAYCFRPLAVRCALLTDSPITLCPHSPDLYLPLGVRDQAFNQFSDQGSESLADRGTHVLMLVGRLADNNTIAHGLILAPTAESADGGTGGNGTITVRGDLSSAKFFVGETYDMLYEFSTPYVKEQPPGGGVSVAAGPRLQLRTWTVVFDDTSTFELRITPQGRDVNVFPFNGVTTGSGNPVLGSPSLSTSSFRVPVMARNIDTKIEIFSDSPLPCRMQSAEWEGWLQNRAPRL